jgi:membrane-bound lytic murein transglycosylase D
VLLPLAGCAVSKQSQFAMPFVPPAPVAAREVAINAEPPALPSNLYLNSEAPTYVSAQSRTPPVPTSSDLSIARADEAFRKGKRFYQSGDKEKAREQFDRAIDLFFEAAAKPTDRQSFERKFEETVDNIHRYDLAGLGSGVAVETPRFEKPPLDDLLELTFPVDPKLKIKVNEQLLATSSQLPLSMNDAVLGFINFFSGRGRKTLIAGLQRSGRYRPLIQRILDEEGVPREMIYLAQAESGFLPRALSYMQAAGMWQFVKFRGQEYGLMQTAYSDDRLDPEKATRSAARHLHDLYAHFGDWYLAIAAYNCGPGCVDKAVERTGFADFWELRSRGVLPIETTNYVPIILAMTIMAKNPAAYDLGGIVPEPALEYDVATMSSPTQMALVADLTETPLSELQELNPALLKNVAPAGYQLNVPRGMGASLHASLETVPPERRASWRMHKVESGETLAMIGKQYGASPSVIAAANRMDSESPMAGDRLVIPQQAAAAAPSVARKSVEARRPAAASKPGTASSRGASAGKASSHGTASHGTTSRNAASRAATAPKGTAKKSAASQPASKGGTLTKAAAGKQASTVGRS